MPEPDLLAAWVDEPKSEFPTPVVMCGDLVQLGCTVNADPGKSMFRSWRMHPGFERFCRNLPYVKVVETMRMTNGLEKMCSDLYYEGALISGPGTALEDPARTLSRTLRDFFHSNYPDLRAEPEGSIYPVHLNVHGNCEAEVHGNSRFNVSNVAVVLDQIKELMDRGLATAEEIAIVTPYTARGDLYVEQMLR